MENTIWPIELSKSEKTLFAKVSEFSISNTREENLEILQALSLLIKSLIKAKKITTSRANYFTLPEYNISSPKTSRKEWFERNGTVGEAIYGHPHIIPYVRYFVEGANVSDTIKKNAQEMIVLAPYKDHGCDVFFNYLKASQLIPKNLNERNTFSDEIFKLVIDADVDITTATRIRNRIKNKR